VPVDASDPTEPLPGLVELLSPHRVIVLGYYPVPDQSSTDQLRDQFGEEATAAVEEIAETFAESGAGADSKVVFTHDRSDTIENVAAENDVDAVLTAGVVEGDLEHILVPLRGDQNLERIVAFVETLMRESHADATFLNVENTEDEASKGELLVRGACDRLEDDGINPKRLDWRQEEGSPGDTIVSVAEGYDLLVVGETKPSLRDRLLGAVANRVIEDTPRPVLIVRH
jgi:nucleotide-binding universal stress UspA family protein